MLVSWPCDLEQPPRLAQAWVGICQPARIQRHFLAGLWQLHIYWHAGELSVVLTDRQNFCADLTPGCISILPPGTTSSYHVPDDGVFTAVHFALGDGDGAGDGDGSQLPFISAPDGQSDALHRRIHAACALATHRAPHAAAELWAVLWQLASQTNSVRRSGSRLVAQARELIESTLADPLPVTVLARRLAVSPAHLRRLFIVETGMPMKRYQLARRLERARHLLMHSDRSQASIAAEIGMPDAHQFNKAVRREFGLAPLHLRAAQIPEPPGKLQLGSERLPEGGRRRR